MGIVLVLLACLYYYIALPAFNIHSSDTWFFLLFLLVVIAVIYGARKRLGRGEIRQSRPMKIFLGLILGVGIVYLVGTLLSSPVINAKKYQKLMTVEEGDFTEDIEELSFDQIPLLDKTRQRSLATGKWEAWWIWSPSLRRMTFTVRSIIRIVRSELPP